MKNDDIELLREVQKNTEMGMHALEVINPKVYDDSMALMLARESFKYGELHDRARAVLLSKNQAPDPVNKVNQLISNDIAEAVWAVLVKQEKNYV